MDFDSNPAYDYSLPELVDILNRGFEDYIIPISLNLPAFLNMMRKDGLDLSMSRILVNGEKPVGIALIARRGWTSRLAAMGIAREVRSMGAGSWFMEQLIQEAHGRDEHEMVLEVIEQNEPAVRLYKRCGFQTIRRLIGLIRKDASEQATGEIEEIDTREAGDRVSRYGLSDLPWQLSGESIAQINPPSRAYCKGPASVVISNPDAKDIAIWSLIVEPSARGNGLGTDMLRAVISQYPDRTWHVPALLPEELGTVYERAGFVREELSQWQMKLDLQQFPRGE
jgi:ribosomal protein S18 acetylase RimI-like enzyme